MNRGLTRLGFTALALVVGQAYVSAQDATTGAIFGTVKNSQGQSLPGARIVLDGGRGQMEYAADASGAFRITGLIPGRYNVSVSAEGYEKRLNMSIAIGVNQRTPVNVVLTKAAAAVVEVVASSGTIDATTVTSGTQFSSETFSALPLGRSFTSIAAMAPGVVNGGIDSANPSIGGGSGLENQYVIDGANTTNPGYGSSGSYSSTYGSLGTGINTDFIQEVQVKSFGMEAEYGQTTGGIVNAITRSGSNTLEGSAFVYLDLDSLQSRAKVPNLIYVDQASFDSSNRMELGFTLSGPIIKDRLFYFIGYNPITETTKRTAPPINTETGDPYELSGQQFTQKRVSNAYYAKFTYQLSATHLLEFSAFGDPGERKNGPQAAIDFRGTANKFSTLKYGTNTYTLKYNGTYFDTWLLEARATQVSNTFERQVGEAGLTEWAVTDTATGAALHLNGVGLYEKKLEGKNKQFEVKVSKSFGDFDFKVGYLMEKVNFDSTNQRSGPLGFSDPHASGTVFTTGLSIQKRYRQIDHALPEDPTNVVPYYRIVRGLTSSPTRNTETDYSAMFVQGGYKIGNFNIKAGLRWEEQKLVGTDITYKFKASDNMSPRLGVTWDIEGNGKSKVYAFFGRYFEKVPLDIAVRALSTEKGVNRSDFSTLTGFSSLSNPILTGTEIWDVNRNTGAITNGATTPSALADRTTHFRTTGSFPTEILPGTKSMYQDEIVLGYDLETNFGMTFSNRLIYRKLGRIMEDLSLDGDSYFIGNPGENEESIRALTGYTGPATFPKPTRQYWALELEARKATSKWQAFCNLRISKVEGNYEGLFRGDNGQDDPNISSLYDLPVEAMEDANRGLTGREQFLIGALPSDRTIVANFSFAYTFDMGLNVGMLGRLSTGTPITTYLAHPIYENAGEIPQYGRGTEGRTPTIYTFDTSLSYPISLSKKMKLTFRGDVFNIFNTQRVLNYDTDADLGLGADNPNYMRATRFDAARSIRLGAKLQF